MIKINHYSFGSIEIDGRVYRNDIIIYLEAIQSDWWRKEGHHLLLVDIADIIKAGPEVLIVGQGDPGLMTVSDEVRDRLEELGIELITQPSREASETFNRLSPKRDTAFAVHLTC